MPNEWSTDEVDAVVTSYLDMLVCEIEGTPYSKAAHRRALGSVLKDRSEGSIEYKYQNVSAALLDLGFPYVDGYKPLANYQRLLRATLAEHLGAESAIVKLVRDTVERPPDVSLTADPLLLLRDPPSGAVKTVAQTGIPPQVTPNYLAREASNRALGLAGERVALAFERARLVTAGRPALADQIEHVAVTQGDGAGYDIHSFDVDGRDLCIEVKTTAYGIYTPFFATRHEVHVSRQQTECYHLYRLFRFRHRPEMYILPGELGQTCHLCPEVYAARPR